MNSKIVLAIILLLSTCTFIKAEEFREIGFIEIEEISEEPGLVSTLGKQFRLIVHHDPLYIPAEDLETFDRSSSPLLTSLLIIKRDLNRETKNPKNITSDFIFDLEANSTDSSEHEGFLETKYLSNTQVIKKASRLNFRVETFDYLDNEQTIDTRNIKTKFNAKYDIEALELDFDNLSFNGDSLSFSAIDSEKKESKVISEDYLVISNIETNLSLSDSIKDLNFKTESATGKKIASKIKRDGSKQSLRLIPKVNNDEITVINTADGTISKDELIGFFKKYTIALEKE